MIDGENRNRNVGPEPAGALAGKLLETTLQSCIDRKTMKTSIGGGGNRRVGRMRRQYRHGPAYVRRGLALGAPDLVRRNDAGGGDAVEHAITGGAHRAGRA